MKRLSHKLLAVATLLLLATAVCLSDPQVNRIQAFTTGTAYRVANNRTIANSLFIQSLATTGVVYVLFADPAATCSASTTSQIVAELSPAISPAVTGQSFTFPSNNTAQSQSGGTDVNFFCVQGTSSDSAVISYNLRN